jgi:hypothetical protein
MAMVSLDYLIPEVWTEDFFLYLMSYIHLFFCF